MDLLMSEMNKLLVSGRENYDIQDIIGESAGKNIDELLNEADKIIGETLPYFQTTSNSNKVKLSKDFENEIVSPNVNTKVSKNQQNETKKVVFNLENNSQSNHVPEKHTKKSGICGKLATNKCIIGEERKINKHSSLKKCSPPELKVPEVNNAKTNLQVSSSIVENHNRLQNICDKHAKSVNNMEAQDEISKLKLVEELNFYKMRNSELEKCLIFKEQEIQEWESRYHQLNQYCELFLKKNIEESLKSFDFQINELIERNMTRESKLHAIINNLLEEIDESHLHYRIKLSDQNKQIRKYLDQIERILDNVYKLRN